jgi:ribosome-associated heat shock protein Hsp15
LKVRVDKWLWSVRIFKSRTIATDACKGGKVKLNSVNVKPSSLIQQDDVLVIRKNGFDFQFRVVKLIEKRVAAPIAQQCYENITPAEEMNKYKEWFNTGKAAAEKRDRGTGRPTKKERREIDEYKEGWFDFDDWEE